MSLKYGLTIFLCAFLAACTSLQPDLSTTDDPAPSSPLELTILHINDHHSRLDEETITLNLTTDSTQRQRITAPLGGFARVTALFDQLAAKHDHVLRIHSGDATTGDLYYSLTQGRADADLMSTVCFDTLTLGNHEFDYGDQGLKDFLEHLRSQPCTPAVLSANTRFAPESPLAPEQAPGYVQPHVILERGGERLGLIGITVAGKTKNSSRPDPGTEFLDEITSAQAQIDMLTAQGINKIILQTHQGYQADLTMAGVLRGVDVIVGGDSHSLLGPSSLNDYGIPVEGSYPTMATDQNGHPVCIVQAGQFAYAVGELQISFDKNGVVQHCSGRPHILIGNDFQRTDDASTALTQTELQHIQNDIDASGSLHVIQPDPAALQKLDPHRQHKQHFGKTVVAHADTPLCSRRTPGARPSARTQSPLGAYCNDNPHLMAHGGDVQQLFSEALLQQGKRYFNADIALQNGGGVRTDIAAGPVSVIDIYTIMPFKNELVQFNLTGAEIKTLLENVAQAIADTGLATGSYPYTAGLRWHLDLTRPHGQRFSNMEVRMPNDDYQPLNMNATYRLVTFNFIADGHDNYSYLGTIRDHRRINIGLDQAEALLDYIQGVGASGQPLSRLPARDYSTQKFTPL